MKRILVAFVAVVVGVVSVTNAQQIGPAAPVAAPASSNPAAELMCENVAELRWEDATFEEVVEWLRERGAVNVLVRWNALLDEGVDPASLVSLNLKDVTIADVLRETLAQVSAEGAVGFVARGNTIRITTRRELSADMIVRVYDIGDLITTAPDFRGPQVRLDQIAGGSSGDTAPILEGYDPGDEDPSERTPASAEEDRPGVQKLREIIEQTIEPESWWIYGGKGTIRGFDRTLVVRNSLEVHEMIAGRFMQR